MDGSTVKVGVKVIVGATGSVGEAGIGVSDGGIGLFWLIAVNVIATFASKASVGVSLLTSLLGTLQAQTIDIKTMLEIIVRTFFITAPPDQFRCRTYPSRLSLVDSPGGF